MFKVQVKGLAGVQQQFIAATKDLSNIIDQELESMAKEWVSGAKRDAPGDQGALREGISYFKISGAINSLVISSNVFYSHFMEFGTKGKYLPIPGTENIAAQMKGFKGGDLMDMLRMIVKWVHRKGITGRFSVKTRKRVGSKVNQFAEDYAAAWPIMMSLLKNGVTPHPFFFKQQDVVWPEMVRKAQRRIQQSSKIVVIAEGDVFRPKIITI